VSGIFAIAMFPDVDCEILEDEESPAAPIPRQYPSALVAPRGEHAMVPMGPPEVAEVSALGAFSAEQAAPYLIGAAGVIASAAILWWGSRPVRQNRRRSRSRR
jgi:hypothetical protein